MSLVTPTCMKCNGEMEEGFVLDNTHGGRLQSEWIEGPPERSVWVGVKLKGKEHLRITTFRCRRCGYLESYAPPPQ